jgi:hypothetical protein
MCALYDLREYEEYNPQQQNKTMTVIHSMYNSSRVSLNLTETLTYPRYYFENMEIIEVFVEEIVFSSNAESVYVYIFPHVGSSFSQGFVTPSEDFVTSGISLLYPIDYEYFRVHLIDLSTVLTPINITIAIDYIIHCAFWRPPKHTISGMMTSIDTYTWIFIGITIMGFSLIVISRRLMREY